MSDESLYIKPKNTGDVYAGADDFVSGITKNLKSEIIHTNKDKLKLVLIEHEKRLKNKHGWSTPFGIFSSLLVTLLTADKFNSFLSVSPDVWKSAIMIGVIISGIWLLVSGIKCLCMLKVSSLEKAITEIMTPEGSSR